MSVEGRFMPHAIRKTTKKSPENEALPYVLTLPEAAKLLRIDGSTLTELVARGEIPGRQIGEEYRFLRPAIEAWLQGTTLKKAVLGVAGSLAGDPYFPGILEELAKARRQSARRS